MGDILHELVVWLGAEALRNFVLSSCAIGALVISTRGLRTWKNQLRGTSDYQLAKAHLTALFHVRDQIRRVRSPVQWTEQTELEEGETHSEKHLRELAAYYDKVLQSLNEQLVTFHVHTLEAEALWGKEIAERVGKLNKCVNKLKTTISFDLMARKENFGHKTAQDRLDVLYESGQDEFSKEISAAIDCIEEFVRTKLR